MRGILFIGGAVACGILCGLAVAQSNAGHKIIARCVRGRAPLAIVHGVGVYEQEKIADAELHYRARQEKISGARVDRELGLVRAQFGDEPRWRAALAANHLSTRALRDEATDLSRSLAWLDRQLILATTEQECRDYFAANETQFTLPARYHVAHLFLAAPAATPEEIVNTKRRTLDELAQRLKTGESFVDLAAQFSEDEATKKRGGDLGWFSSARMPEDFMKAVHALTEDATSAVVPSRLGFHILRLIEAEPARPMSFEEARPEIIAAIENARRRQVVAKLHVDLASSAQVVQSE